MRRFRMKGGAVATDVRLGRVASFDEASRNYPIRALLDRTAKPRSYTWRLGLHLDQGNTPACTGFSTAHELAAKPVVVPHVDQVLAMSLYIQARKNDEWPGECVDMETTCLSKRGWLNGDELEEGDEILTFDIEREGLEWMPVEAVHRYDSKPYRIWENNQMRLAVTDNHKWLVRSRVTETGYSLVPTTELLSQHQFPRAAPLLDQLSSPMFDDDEVELVAWAITEGHFRPNRGRSIIVTQKSHRSRVTELMERLGVARGYRKADGCHVWEVSGERAQAVREAVEGSVEWLSRLTKRQLRLFIDACVLADGTTTLGAKWDRMDRRSFFQKPGPALDLFLAACALAGIATSRARAGDCEAWSLRASSDVEVRKLKAGPYISGPVWCPQTANRTFVARRDGYVFITGNSYDGSSVLGAVKAASEGGYYDEYRWAFGIDDLILAVGHHGPAILGVNWYTGQMQTDDDGYVHVTGQVEGEHAICATGVNVRRERFWLSQSWGLGWGLGGGCWISFTDVDRLLHEDGEACIPVKRERGAGR